MSAVITQTVAARRGSARGIRMFQGVSTRPLRCLRALRSRPPLQPRYETTSCSESVIDYVLRRLNGIGVDAIFGVVGDFAFPIQDAIVNDPRIDWVGCCNELNAQ